MRYLILLTSFLALSLTASGQQWLVGAETVWSDSFVEWKLYTASESEEEEEELEATGELELRWKNQDNWTEWDYEFEEEEGQISQASRSRPDHWELRSNGRLITMRPRWSNDFTEWKITSGSSYFIFKSKWRNNLDEWFLVNDKYGHFSLKTAWERDPRQWDIYDELDEDVSLSMKMAMVFVATFYSSPKI